ncbi:spermatogenesis-associated protein 48 isoform X1 [Megalobrama amblycephala]|uniref:spermatogenesis-associated protein 48 isoform X1 n=1 Tax=Megalobrama amblycephala TaxID=75352 RepID=UPI0020143445|nr:spermatogenesis-associated protein 48 isoform X1 [Megalobrama amblycephala]
MENKREPYHVRLLKTPCVSSDGVSRWLCRRMNLPCEKGPEGRYDFESMVETDRRAFSRFNPGAQMPDENAALAPLRDDMTLIDPCSGQLSAGAHVRLEAKSRTPFIETVYTPSDLWVPAGARDRPQTPPTRPSALIYDNSEHKRWNSRMNLEAALKANLGGWTSAQSIKHPSEDSHEINAGTRPSVLYDSVATAARQYIYSSAAQRGYENVDWDSKLPPRHKPPTTTLEKMADPVSQRFVLKRYHSRPELWQAIGSHWNKHQLRATFYTRKPISFTSPCPKSGHVPLYCGTVGSENMDSVDVPDEDFIPLTVLRTTVPPHTPASYRTTIPGYTGKAKFDRPQTSAVSFPSLPYTPQTAGSRPGTWSSSHYGHKAPLSGMVTTVPPGNPYIHPKAPVLSMK